MFKIGFALFVVLVLASCGQGDDYSYYYNESSEYVHLIKPMDSETVIKSIEYPEASKLITYDSSGAQRLLVSAYVNTLVKVTTNNGIFNLLLKPDARSYYDPSEIFYYGYDILNNTFNDYKKTSTIEIDDPENSYKRLYLDTLYFK